MLVYIIGNRTWYYRML